MPLGLLTAVFLGMGLQTPRALLAEVGGDAPIVEPSQWLNASGAISWDRLKGRVIVVEKWATW